MITLHPLTNLYRGIRFALGILLFTLLSTAHAAVLFQENFDNTPPYTNGGTLPSGFNTINYGSWTNNASGTGSATTTTAAFLSATRSLELTRGATGGSNVTGRFGLDNTAGTSTTDSIVIRFAFNLTTAMVAEDYIRSSSGTILGYVQMVGNGATNNYIRAFYNGVASTTRVSIDLNTWYYAEVLMPASPNIGGQYSLTVYESDGLTQRGVTSSGGFYAAPTGATNYSYFSLYNQTANSTAYFDNFSVYTVPEPDVLALVSGALLMGGLSRCIRKKRKA